MTEAESEMANVLPFILYYGEIHYFRFFGWHNYVYSTYKHTRP